MFFQKTDEDILLAIQKHRNKFITWVMILFTWTGKGRVWVAVAIFCNLVNHFIPAFNPYFLKAFYAPLMVWAINKILKGIVKRGRPETCGKGIIALVKEHPERSFPSSHSGSTFAFSFVLYLWHFPEAKVLFIWATLVSFSRMYLGVHYLSDILAGVIVGIFAAAITYSVF